MKKYSVYTLIVSLCSILMYGMINGAIDKDEMFLKSTGAHESSTGLQVKKHVLNMDVMINHLFNKMILQIHSNLEKNRIQCILMIL